MDLGLFTVMLITVYLKIIVYFNEVSLIFDKQIQEELIQYEMG